MDPNSSPHHLAAYQAALDALAHGKRLPGAVYVLDDPAFVLPAMLREIVDRLRLRLQLPAEFNVLKFSTRELKLSFLAYPDFLENPHPALREGVSIDLVTGKARRTDYGGRANPPILHRKETFLPPDHPSIPEFRQLTEEEEAAGLYRETSTIGFKLNWERLLASKGLAYRGHRLVTADSGTEASGPAPLRSKRIERHRTALSRAGLSKPIKTLLDHSLLGPNDTLFDFGCGQGDDVAGLAALGYDATGWDPHFAPHAGKRAADIVNLGFVLNVIEDPAERVGVLVDAWSHARRLLVVATLVAGRETYAYAESFADGLVTVRNTFQKYFEQAELSGLIEHALHAEPVTVEMGICYVFRNIEDQQDFLSRRTRRAIDWEHINTRLRLLRPTRVRLSVYDRHPELLDDFWRTLLELGRVPQPDEYPRYDEIRSACKSANKARLLFIEKYGEEPLSEARQRRKEDLLVYLAAGEFQKRRTPLAHLSAPLRADLKAFFGHYASACDQARDLLFAAGDPDEIQLALEDLDFGWFDAAEGHFTLHSASVERLPAILRIYIECAARLYGDPRQADLIKLHVHSRKLTFLHYDDFNGKPLPELVTRIKIDLRRLFVNVFDHSTGPKHQLLFFKERFLPPDYPERESMETYSRRLRKLGINETMLGSNDIGAPSREEFEAALEKVGLTRGLARKPEIPPPTS